MSQPGTSLRLRRIGLGLMLKQSLKARLCRWLAPWAGGRWGTVALQRLPQWIRRLPRAWRGSDYRLCEQNLRTLGHGAEQASTRAALHSALQIQRAINQHRYDSGRVDHLRAWVRSILWRDDHGYFEQSLQRPAMVLLTHTGEYWIAVATLVERYPAPRHFMVPIARFADAFTCASIKHLEAFGHTVDVADVNDPAIALSMMRAIKRGATVIIFSDLPVSLGEARFGEPCDGHLFERPAQFLRGPVQIAARLGCDVLLAGHRAQPGGRGEMHIRALIGHASAPQMMDQWARAFEVFIQESPENWMYLARMEAFYHRQKPFESLRPMLPRALRKGVQP